MKNGKLLIAPSMLWLGIFFIVPMLIVVAVSFAARTPYGQVVFNWNINNYLRFVFWSPYIFPSLHRPCW